MPSTTRIIAAALALLTATLHGQAQDKTEGQIKTEYEQAQTFYTASNFVSALPLFEDLHARQPQDLIYEERLAMSLLGAASTMAPDANHAAHVRAKALLLDAQARGDKSPLLITLLEKMGDSNGEPTMPTAPATPAEADFAQAEKFFSGGNLKDAFTFYQKALSEDPTYYAAALYAGDSLFKLGDCPQASVYYAKAVAIDPDHETAYRYWGDCLVKLHDLGKAESKYIDAVIAQPYQKTPRQSLETWAKLNHAMILAPPITLPARATTGKDGHINITLDAGKTIDPESSLALLYSMNSALWQGDKFKKAYPKETVYRHSLAEEIDSIKGMLAVARELKIPANKLSTSTKLLMELEKSAMLECWILLDDPDNGIAQDYVAYRKDHRELMEKYIAQYDVHLM